MENYQQQPPHGEGEFDYELNELPEDTLSSFVALLLRGTGSLIHHVVSSCLFPWLRNVIIVTTLIQLIRKKATCTFIP